MCIHTQKQQKEKGKNHPIAFGNANNKVIKQNKNKTKALINATIQKCITKKHQKQTINTNQPQTTNKINQTKTYKTKKTHKPNTTKPTPYTKQHKTLNIKHQNTHKTINKKPSFKTNKAQPTGLPLKKKHYKQITNQKTTKTPHIDSNKKTPKHKTPKYTNHINTHIPRSHKDNTTKNTKHINTHLKTNTAPSSKFHQTSKYKPQKHSRKQKE